MAKSGGCRCGAVRYSVEGDPAHSALCWCSDCRASAGAPVVQWTLFPKDAVAIEGSPVSYESSPGTTRQFCGACGTGLFYLNETIFPGQIDIQGASFDDPDAYPPGIHIQTADAPGWREALNGMPAFERYPPVPA